MAKTLLHDASALNDELRVEAAERVLSGTRMGPVIWDKKAARLLRRTASTCAYSSPKIQRKCGMCAESFIWA
jgi:hypothetical protein